MFRETQVVLALLFISLAAHAGDDRLTSGVYAWDDLEVIEIENGERRPILDGATSSFEHFHVHGMTLEAGASLDGPLTHDDVEELLIIKEGSLEVMINGQGRVLPTGSVSLILPGDAHGIRNVGPGPASYYVLRWRTSASNVETDTAASSLSVNWDEVELKQIAKGGRRQLLQHPTSMLTEFEMHTTTLKQGWKSHDQHVHVEDEIILVRFGQVEQLIDSIPHAAGPGAVIFLQADQPHGIRNAGEGPCEYYAFKWRLPTASN